MLNVGGYDLSIRGQVRHARREVELGIEFREIRKGDRQILHFLQFLPLNATKVRRSQQYCILSQC